MASVDSEKEKEKEREREKGVEGVQVVNWLVSLGMSWFKWQLVSLE